MIAELRHIFDTTNGQRVSRLSLTAHLGSLFSIPHIFLIQFDAAPQTAHWLLPDIQAVPSQNQKSHFLANAPTKIRILTNLL